MKDKSLIIIFSVVLSLLLIPLIAMQFTDEVNWTISDFVIAAVLLSGTGLIGAFVLPRIKNVRYRIVIGVALLLVLLLLWAELSVGIFGLPFAGN